MKSAKSLWSHDFPGPITENFANMILVNCCFFMLVICILEILLWSTIIFKCTHRFCFSLYPESSLWCRWIGDRLLTSVKDADLVDPGPDKTTQVVPGQVSLFANNRHQLSRVKCKAIISQYVRITRLCQLLFMYYVIIHIICTGIVHVHLFIQT